jgi:hypothetical protein
MPHLVGEPGRETNDIDEVLLDNAHGLQLAAGFNNLLLSFQLLLPLLLFDSVGDAGRNRACSEPKKGEEG